MERRGDVRELGGENGGEVRGQFGWIAKGTSSILVTLSSAIARCISHIFLLDNSSLLCYGALIRRRPHVFY